MVPQRYLTPVLEYRTYLHVPTYLFVQLSPALEMEFRPVSKLPKKTTKHHTDCSSSSVDGDFTRWQHAWPQSFCGQQTRCVWLDRLGVFQTSRAEEGS